MARRNHIHNPKTPAPGDEIDEVAPKEVSVTNSGTYTKSITNESLSKRHYISGSNIRIQTGFQ
jgi:hypothetical protein